MKLLWILWYAAQVFLQKWRTYSTATRIASHYSSLFSAPFRDYLGWKKNNNTKKLSCSRRNQGIVPHPNPEHCRRYKVLAPLSQVETALKSHSSSRASQDISLGLYHLLLRSSHVFFPSFYIYWSEEYFLIITLYTDLHFRVWFLVTPNCDSDF